MKVWKIIVIIMTIFAVFTWVAYFSSPYASHSLSNIGSNIKSISSKVSLGIKSYVSGITEKANGCEEKAGELISDTITLRYNSVLLNGENRGENKGWTAYADNYWTDGTKMSKDSLIVFTLGHREGENINYFYNRYVYGTDGFIYSKNIISDEGVISGTRTFSIKPILKPLDEDRVKEIHKENLNSVYNLREQQFEIIEANIINCDWIKA